MTRATGTIDLPQWAVTRRFVYSDDVDFNPYAEEQSSADTDLSGATIYFTVRNKKTHEVVISKSSGDINEIEVLPPATAGGIAIKFVESDTVNLHYSENYYFDVWGDIGDGRIEPIVDRGRFLLRRSATRISQTGVTTLPGPSTPALTTPIRREGTIVEALAREGAIVESDSRQATVSTEGTAV